MQQIGVSEIFKHKSKDIALIKLSEAINITDHITPICLPEDGRYNNFRELELHICKRTKKSRKSIVSIVPVSPLSPQDCSIMFERKNANFSHRFELCAWDEIGDTCTGDLGGPLVGKVNGHYQVIGLNSYVNVKVTDYSFFEINKLFTQMFNFRTK